MYSHYFFLSSPFQSNNSLEPLGDIPNLCVIPKWPARPTFILFFTFLLVFFFRTTPVEHSTYKEARDDMLCLERDE